LGGLITVYLRLSPNTLRKKLAKTICTPIIKAVIAGMMMRSVCTGSSVPKLARFQVHTE
jgi:hypothetical protein